MLTRWRVLRDTSIPSADAAPTPSPTRQPGQQAPRPPVITIAAQDVEYFRTVSEQYRTLTGVKNAPAMIA